MIFGAIVAGGKGERLVKSASINLNEPLPNIPKQFLPLAGKPIICHSIDKFLKVLRIDNIIIGVHADYLEYMQNIINEHYFAKKDKIMLTVGGNDRNETLMNIIDLAETHYGESDEHIIVTHDAVRPFVSVSMIEENIDKAIKFGAVDTVYSATDTVVLSKNGSEIDAVLNRNEVYNGQTPQSFNMKQLKNLYNALDSEQKKLLTDACRIFASAGLAVHFAKGDSSNIKITTKSDLIIAESLAKYLL